MADILNFHPAVIYLNGQFLSKDRAVLCIKDRGLLLGDGIFETLKYSEGKLQFFSQHFSRVKRSADALLLPLNYQEKELAQVCAKLLDDNHLSDKMAAIRITLTRGMSDRGVNLPEPATPTLFITATNYENVNHSIKVTRSAIQRNSTSMTSQHKTLSYIDNVMARVFAKAKGFDDAIFLNEKKHMASASVSNLFFVKNKQVMTPSLACGILPGIMRAHIIKLCQNNQIPIVEGEWTWDEFVSADEVFVTNSLVGIQPVICIEEKQLGSFPGPVTQFLVKNILLSVNL